VFYWKIIKLLSGFSIHEYKSLSVDHSETAEGITTVYKVKAPVEKTVKNDLFSSSVLSI
jgi:hypothetical protein